METSEAFKHFIAGFVSGEGSFFVSLQRNTAYKTNTQVVCGTMVTSAPSVRSCSATNVTQASTAVLL